MKNESYWKKRQEEKLEEILEDATESSNAISKYYQKACDYVQGEINQIFNKYKNNYGLSEREARRLLSSLTNQHDYDELLRELRNNPSSKEKRELLKQLDAPAYQARIKRLAEMQSNLDELMHEVYNLERETSVETYIKNAYKAYYKDIYMIQQGMNVAYSFSELDPKLVDTILRSKWSGKNFSSRIWSNTTALADKVKDEMMLGVLTGKTEKKMAETIMKIFSVGAFQARRLIQTESAAITAYIDQKAYEEAKIDKEMFIAVHDNRTTKVCQQHDRTIIKLSEAQVGKNVPPLHPNCRSYMVPYFKGVTETMKKRQRNPITGRDEVVNAKENYEQWLKRQQKEHSIQTLDAFINSTKKLLDQK